MNETGTIPSQQPPPVLSRVAVVAGAITACGFGTLAGMAYGMRIVGASAGLVLGVMAGLLWSRWMIPRLRRGGFRYPESKGGTFGMLVGVLATLALHAVLALCKRGLDPDLLLIGILCGTISGFVVGEVCTRVWICREGFGRRN